MRKRAKHAVRSLFLRIAEPRHIRIIQFGIYVCMVFAGIGILNEPPSEFEGVVGLFLTLMLGSFITLGSLLGAIAVLPGIWWLERTGIIALGSGLAMYLVLVISLQSSPVGVAVSSAFILTFIQRYTEIKGSQLAPREE